VLPNEELEPFFDEGLITGVVRPIKSGKEASVHLCSSDPSITGARLLALKRYHPRERRNFKDTSRYVEGRVLPDNVRRGIARKGRAGRALEMGLWIEHEWATLGWLHRHGVRVPEPLARSEDSILMAWVGDADGPAPQLRSTRLDADETALVFDELLRQIRLMLHVNVIHADLSAYNVLVWDGEPWIIDVPQSIDPREHQQAEELLRRDVTRICEHFERSGVSRDPVGLATDLWTAWTFADLIPGDLLM
jgi:RIO kinase 1